MGKVTGILETRLRLAIDLEEKRQQLKLLRSNLAENDPRRLQFDQRIYKLKITTLANSEAILKLIDKPRSNEPEM